MGDNSRMGETVKTRRTGVIAAGVLVVVVAGGAAGTTFIADSDGAATPDAVALDYFDLYGAGKFEAAASLMLPACRKNFLSLTEKAKDLGIDAASPVRGAKLISVNVEGSSAWVHTTLDSPDYKGQRMQLDDGRWLVTCDVH
jgi:hypothetical protein